MVKSWYDVSDGTNQCGDETLHIHRHYHKTREAAVRCARKGIRAGWLDANLARVYLYDESGYSSEGTPL